MRPQPPYSEKEGRELGANEIPGSQDDPQERFSTPMPFPIHRDWITPTEPAAHLYPPDGKSTGSDRGATETPWLDDPSALKDGVEQTRIEAGGKETRNQPDSTHVTIP